MMGYYIKDFIWVGFPISKKIIADNNLYMKFRSGFCKKKKYF